MPSWTAASFSTDDLYPHTLTTTLQFKSLGSNQNHVNQLDEFNSEPYSPPYPFSNQGGLAFDRHDSWFSSEAKDSTWLSAEVGHLS